MRIALLLDDSMDRPDGVQQFVTSLGHTLVAAGHEVVVVCSAGSDGEDGDPAAAGGLPVVPLARNMGVSFNGNRLRTPLPADKARIRAWLEEFRPDVIHVQTPHSPAFAGRVVREARRVLGDSVRIVGTFVILPDGGFSAASTRVLGAALRGNLKRFDAFSALSEPAADFARKTFGIECIVTPHPIPVDGFRAQARLDRLPDEQRPLTLSFLGRFVPRKGVLEFIEAIDALPREVHPYIRVRMAGRGPLLDKARRLIASKFLRGVISLEGYLPESDKAQFLHDADLAVFPAMSGESFGIVVAEAMAAGAGVVIGGDNPGYRYVLQDEAVLVDPKDTAAFARTLTTLLADPAERTRIHEAQQLRVRDFDVPAVYAGIMELYGVR